MPFATAPDGVQIHYDVLGERGPTAVLIQGLGMSARFWFDLPSRLASAPDRWRVVTLDNRGVGQSGRPSVRYSMAAMADDVAAVLDDAHIDRAFVVGISLGGMVAQHVALRHPECVEGLVLLATTAGVPHFRPPRARALATLLTLPLGGRLRPRKKVGPSFARLVLSPADAQRAADLLARWPAALREEPTSLRVYAAQLGAALRHSTGARLGALACPTVIITGDEDALMPSPNSAILAKLVPGAELEVLRGRGHVIPASDPECIRRALARVYAMAAARPPALRGAASAALVAPIHRREVPRAPVAQDPSGAR